MTDQVKEVKITLAWYIHEYKVKTITNTTAFKPGEWLNVEQVEKLCERPNFEVLMVDNELLAEITGVASDMIKGGASL